jgi:hypothetical protein
MLIRYLDGKTEHVMNPMGRALIAAKLAVEMRMGQLGMPITVEEAEQQRAVAHETSWRVQPGQRIEDYQGAPRIFYSCTCGVRGFTSGRTLQYNGGESLRPGANKTMIPFLLQHTDGAVESIPAHIQKEFDRLNARHDATRRKDRNAKRKPQALDICTAPVRSFAHPSGWAFGVKPLSVLQAEMRDAAKKHATLGEKKKI